MIIRPANAHDLDAIAALWTSVVGDPITGDALRLWDELALETDRRLRLVGEEDGRVVALLGLVRTIDSAVCGVRLFVDPAFRRRGIAAGLLRRAQAFAAISACDSLATTARDEASEAFALERGFSAIARTIILERSLDEGDPIDDATPPGIELRLVSELPGDADDAFYVTVRALGDGLGPQLFSRTHFDARVLGRDGRYRALQVVALAEERIVGVACVEPFPGARALLHTLTAVAPSHRGRGIGTALKLRTMRAARDWGATRLIAHTLPTNAPMLAIQCRAGFRERGTEVTLVARV